MSRKDILNRKDDILKWIEDDKPKNFICRELKCRPGTLNVYLKIMSIEYIGKRNWSKNKIFIGRLIPAFIYLENGSLIGSDRLKQKLFRDNIKERKCEICETIEWNGLEVPLELHHIDGDRHNNELLNLQILCPNCHAQTSNFNRTKDFIKNGKRQKHRKTKKCKCSNDILETSKRCSKCDKINQRKVKDRPSNEDLVKMINESNLESVGRKYGVTGNAVKKWLNK